MILVERIEQLMAKLQIKSWRRLAQLAGISPGYMGDIKNHRTEPSLTTLRSLASSLETSVSYLIGESNRPNPSDEDISDSSDRSTTDLKMLTDSLSSEEPGIGMLLIMANRMLPDLDKKDRRFLAATIMFALTQATKKDV